MSRRYTSTGVWTPHIVALDRNRTKHDGCRLERSRPMSWREAFAWCALFVSITAGGIGASLYYTNPPAPASTTPAHQHFAIKNGVGCGAYSDAPAYTASLDAAMTLVPERAWVRMDQWPRDFCAPVASVMPVVQDEGNSVYTATGTTLALALVAASLRARAAMEQPA